MCRMHLFVRASLPTSRRHRLRVSISTSLVTIWRVRLALQPGLQYSTLTATAARTMCFGEPALVKPRYGISTTTFSSVRRTAQLSWPAGAWSGREDFFPPHPVDCTLVKSVRSEERPGGYECRR